jgi:mannobiose 2-epimerase
MHISLKWGSCRLLILSCLVVFIYGNGQSQAAIDTSLLSIQAQMQYSLKEELIRIYYPSNIDTINGGYLTDFDYRFQSTGPHDKMIVTQARHVWTTAKAGGFYKDSTYFKLSRHGFLFLRDKMWDKEYGGFHNLVSRQGEVKSTMKEAYGNAFAIYALAAYYHATRDKEALALAKNAFAWLEKHSHDPIHKGYYQHLDRSGKPVQRSSTAPPGSNIGYKDQNSSIHLLEAFTELYQVWPDALLKSRLREMLQLIRDTMVHRKGYLQLFFTPSWEPISTKDSTRETTLRQRYIDHVSFGHDVETAWLMMEASEVLGNKNDKRTTEVAKKMVDHALQNGYDRQTGGFYDQGFYFAGVDTISIIKHSKNWWAQAEGLHTLLVFARMYPADANNYRLKFSQLWDYIQQYLVDHEHGDWYEEGIDHDPARKTSAKSHIWKATYHNFRSLSNCIHMLEKGIPGNGGVPTQHNTQ